MTVYELPIGFSFPEGTNTANNIKYLATMLGITSTKALWSIEPIPQEDESIPDMSIFGISQNLTGEVSRLGHKRTFMPGLSILLIQDTINQLKESVSS